MRFFTKVGKPYIVGNRSALKELRLPFRMLEKKLSYFRNRTNNSVSSHGRTQTGMILSATGSVLNPIMDAENLSASDKVSFSIINLQGKYIVSEDGQVQQEGPLTIVCAGSSGVVVGGRVNGHLVAANLVQVMVGRFYA